MVRKFIKDALSVGLGSAIMAKKATENVISRLVDQGKISSQEGERILKEWQSENAYRKASVDAEIKKVIEKVLHKMQIPTRSEYELLQKRLDILEKKLADRPKAS